MGEPTVVDFVENALAASTDEILQRIRTSPEAVLERRDDVLTLVEETWIDPSLSAQRQHEQSGELWPILPRYSPDVLSLARSQARTRARYGASRKAAESSRRDIQSLLLYAHGLHLPDPLTNATLLSSDTSEFLRALSQICLLAPLVSAGVVRVFDPGPPPALDLPQDRGAALEEMAATIGLALRSYEGMTGMNQGALRRAADVLIERSLDHLVQFADRSDAEHGSVLFSTPYDGPTINAMLHLLADDLGIEGSVRRDTQQLRLDRLVDLRLPGLDDLDLRHMVSIRDDTSFGVFRSDMAAALRDAEGAVKDDELGTARRIVGEHMDAGLAKLTAGTRRGVLGDATLGDAIGWGLGAAVAASLAGLVGAIALLLGKTASDVARKWPSPGQRALRAHYIELGTESLTAVNRTTVDFATISTDQLWGPSPGLPGRSSSRQAVVRSILDDLGDWENE
jgi:hypothetical protein